MLICETFVDLEKIFADLDRIKQHYLYAMREISGGASEIL